MPREAVSLQQKKALREWYFSHSTPRPNQQQCIQWFEERFKHCLHQSNVSRYLSARFQHLDSSSTSITSSSSLNTLKQRPGQWHKLEEILYQWQRMITAQGGLTSGEILCHKARQIG